MAHDASIPSSPDPLQLDFGPTSRALTVVRPSSPSNLAPVPSRNKGGNKKRAMAHSPERISQPPAPEIAPTSPQTVSGGLQLALNEIIKTTPLAVPGSREQMNLLLLQDIIRDFMATNSIVNKANGMLASNLDDMNKAVKDLTKVSRSLGNQVHQLTSKTATPIESASPTAQQPTPSPQHSPQPTQPQSRDTQPKQAHSSHPQNKPATYSAKVTQGHLPTQGWTIVTPKKTAPHQPSTQPTTQPTAQPTTKPSRKDHQVILLRETTTPIDSMALRNAINQAFRNKGVDKPVVSSVQLSNKGNIVVTGMPDFPARYLLEKKSTWQSVVTFTTAIPCRSWCKVAIHGIPTNVNLNDLPKEITTFNQGLHPVGKPYWLSSQEKRASKAAGSACIAFESEQDAQKAIKEKIFAFGVSLRVEKLQSCPPTTQCTNCQQFGHPTARCRNKVACSICSRSHPTANHRCNHCKAKGKKCIHSTLQCTNCKKPHTSDSPECEVFQALQTPVSASQPPSSAPETPASASESPSSTPQPSSSTPQPSSSAPEPHSPALQPLSADSSPSDIPMDCEC